MHPRLPTCGGGIPLSPGSNVYLDLRGTGVLVISSVSDCRTDGTSVTYFPSDAYVSIGGLGGTLALLESPGLAGFLGHPDSSAAPGATTTAQTPVTIPGPWGVYQTGGRCTGQSADALSFNVSAYNVSPSQTDIMASVDNLADLPVSLIAPRRLSVEILDASNSTLWSATMPDLPTVLPNCTDARLTFTWNHATLAGQYTAEMAVGGVQYEASGGAFTERVSPVTHAFGGTTSETAAAYQRPQGHPASALESALPFVSKSTVPIYLPARLPSSEVAPCVKTGGAPRLSNSLPSLR